LRECDKLEGPEIFQQPQKKRVSAEPAILPQAGDLAERGCRTLAVRDTRRKDEHMAGYPLDIAHISVHIQIYVPYWAVLLK